MNAALLVLVLLAASLPAAAEAGPDRERAVQAVLSQREAAIRTGDRGRFLATIDPGAGPEFVARQARLFDGLRSVPLARYRLRLRTDEIPDLSAGLRGRYGVDDVFLPPVDALYRIEGADATDAVDTFFYTFLRRDGRWRIVSDSDVEDLGLPSARNLWDFGPVARLTSARFTVLFYEGDRRRAETLSNLAEEAYGRLAERFDRPLPERVVLVVPRTVEQLREILQATFDLSNFVAFASASIDRDGGWHTTSPRVYVHDANLARSPRAFQLETLHHELVHVAAFPLAGPFVPVWVHEGVADWMATGGGRGAAVAGGCLPRDFEFTTGGGSAIAASYQKSFSAIAFLAEARGVSAPLDLLVAAGGPRMVPGTADHHLDAALRSVYGAGLADFERAWGGGGERCR